MIELVPIDAVKASEYNPRKNDEKRLALTEMSLRKLGFLLPIYADKDGEILSGHQRHLVATRMGFPKIPVQYVEGKDLNERKTVNVLFNRATNDLQKQDTCEKIKKRLYNMDIQGMCEAIPDIEPGTEASYPCVFAARRVDIVQLAKKNHRNFDSHMKALAKTLERSVGSSMPVVIGQDMNVINGIGRLQVAAESGRKFIQCVQIRPEQEEFASAMLNLLSMDFSMESEYADVLRYNSFMRERNTRETDAEGNCALGDGFFKGLFPNNNGRDFFKLEGDVAKCFSNMLERSIPDYRSMRSLVYELGEKFIKSGTWITDIGCSTGLAIEPFFNTHKDECGYFMVDNSEAMLQECMSKFEVGIEHGNVKIVNGNFWEVEIPEPQSLVLSVLSLQFMPTAYRQDIINRIYEVLQPGGAFILVEKVIASEDTDNLMVESYYDMKRANGYTEDAIQAKRRSLENVLSPLKAEWNENMLHEAGFQKVDMFWRCLNFCGWIAIK